MSMRFVFVRCVLVMIITFVYWLPNCNEIFQREIKRFCFKQNICLTLHCYKINISILAFIIHHIFSLARDWSKCVSWANIRGYNPPNNFHVILLATLRHVVYRSSQFSSSFALRKLFASRNR